MSEPDGNTPAFVLTRSETTTSLMVSYTLSGAATNGTDYSASPVFFGMAAFGLLALTVLLPFGRGRSVS